MAMERNQCCIHHIFRSHIPLYSFFSQCCHMLCISFSCFAVLACERCMIWLRRWASNLISCFCCSKLALSLMLPISLLLFQEASQWLPVWSIHPWKLGRRPISIDSMDCFYYLIIWSTICHYCLFHFHSTLLVLPIQCKPHSVAFSPFAPQHNHLPNICILDCHCRQ